MKDANGLVFIQGGTMQIQELFNLSVWYMEKIEGSNILKYLQELYNILYSNANNTTKQPFSTEQENLNTVLSEVNTIKLNDNQLEVLEKYNILKYLGKSGVNHIEDILYKNNLDLATAASKINDIISLFAQATNNFGSINKDLALLVQTTQDESNDNILKIHFKGGVAINNIVDLKDWSSNWYTISRGITMVNNEPPETFKIVSTENGSIVLLVSASIPTILLLSKIIKAILEVVEKIYAIKIQKEELIKLKLENSITVAKLLNDDIKKLKKTKVDMICEDILSSNDGEHDGEIKTNLKKSIFQLVNFIEKGGSVDIDALAENADNEEKNDEQLVVRQFKENFEAIRALQERILLIEGKSGSNESDEEQVEELDEDNEQS